MKSHGSRCTHMIRRERFCKEWIFAHNLSVCLTLCEAHGFFYDCCIQRMSGAEIAYPIDVWTMTTLATLGVCMIMSVYILVRS